MLTTGSRDTREHHQHNVNNALGVCNVVVLVLIYVCLFVCFWPHLAVLGILVPPPGVELMPLAVEAQVLTVGPPGKSLSTYYLKAIGPLGMNMHSP